MKTKYFNDAIIGNKNVRATFSKKGELLRLYYPSIDYRQFIDELMVGLKINDSRLINLYNDINNVYSQNYIEDTNIINTEIKNSSRRFSVGLIIAIVIPSIVVIIGLIVIGIVCSRVNSPPPKPNLPNKNIDISSSELNKEENNSQSNQRIKGDNSTVNI